MASLLEASAALPRAGCGDSFDLDARLVPASQVALLIAAPRRRVEAVRTRWQLKGKHHVSGHAAAIDYRPSCRSWSAAGCCLCKLLLSEKSNASLTLQLELGSLLKV